jgi:hypothetical protein
MKMETSRIHLKTIDEYIAEFPKNVRNNFIRISEDYQGISAIS